MKSSRTFGNIVVVAIVAAMWCIASTVYHAPIINQQFVYASLPMSGTQVITALWSIWTVGVAVALAIGCVYDAAARKERAFQAACRLYS